MHNNPGNFKDLKIWQKAMELTMEIYSLVRLLPKEETYALSDQMRRAAVSIPSNIAEGQGRGSDKEFIQFLYFSRGSILELSTQLEICQKIGYITSTEATKASELITETCKMMQALIKYRKGCTGSSK